MHLRASRPLNESSTTGSPLLSPSSLSQYIYRLDDCVSGLAGLDMDIIKGVGFNAAAKRKLGALDGDLQLFPLAVLTKRCSDCARKHKSSKYCRFKLKHATPPACVVAVLGHHAAIATLSVNPHRPSSGSDCSNAVAAAAAAATATAAKSNSLAGRTGQAWPGSVGSSSSKSAGSSSADGGDDYRDDGGDDHLTPETLPPQVALPSPAIAIIDSIMPVGPAHLSPLAGVVSPTAPFGPTVAGPAALDAAHAGFTEEGGGDGLFFVASDPEDLFSLPPLCLPFSTNKKEEGMMETATTEPEDLFGADHRCVLLPQDCVTIVPPVQDLFCLAFDQALPDPAAAVAVAAADTVTLPSIFEDICVKPSIFENLKLPSIFEKQSS